MLTIIHKIKEKFEYNAIDTVAGPSLHKTFATTCQLSYNDTVIQRRPLVQHSINVIQMFCVYWG